MSLEDRSGKRIEDLERRLKSRGEDRDLLRQLINLYKETGRPEPAAALLESRLLAGEDDWEIVRECAESYRLSEDPTKGYQILRDQETEQGDRAPY